MSDERGKARSPDGRSIAGRYLRAHARAYAAAAAVLLVASLATGDRRWFIWPAIVWGCFVLLHYFYVKSTRVDNLWAERRAAEVVDKAYDQGHIEDIQKRHAGKRTPRTPAFGDRRGAPSRDPSKRDAD